MQFAPTYHDYVLYNSNNDGDEGTAATKYRSRTFVPTGQEMDAVRRNKHVLGNNRSDDQIPMSYPSAVPTNIINEHNQTSLSVETTMKKSLLNDVSAQSAQPYDLSLIDVDLSRYPTSVPAATSTFASGRSSN